MNAARRIDRRSVRLAACLTFVPVATLLLHALSTPTMATWAQTTQVTGTSVTAAVLDLRVSGANSVTSFTSMNTPPMTPGSSVAGVLPVRNSGTVPLTYFATATASNTDGKGLASALTVKVTSASSASGTVPQRTCDGTAAADAATTFTSPFVASAAAPRTIEVGAVHYLCIQAGLAGDAPTTLQTATTTVNFNFRAEGVPVNPWNDSVPVTGAVLTTATIAPTPIRCGAELANKQVTIGWDRMPGATGYRVYYGTGGAQSTVVGSTAASYAFKYAGTPLSGTARVEVIYGSPTWTSIASESRNYYVDDTTATCS